MNPSSIYKLTSYGSCTSCAGIRITNIAYPYYITHNKIICVNTTTYCSSSSASSDEEGQLLINAGSPPRFLYPAQIVHPAKYLIHNYLSLQAGRTTSEIRAAKDTMGESRLAAAMDPNETLVTLLIALLLRKAILFLS